VVQHFWDDNAGSNDEKFVYELDYAGNRKYRGKKKKRCQGKRRDKPAWDWE